MIMKLPIMERKAIIHKHNVEQQNINDEIEGKKRDSNTRTYEGESINAFAELEQKRRMMDGGR